MRERFTTWWHEPVARGWALAAFLGLAIAIALAIDGSARHAANARHAIITSGRAVSVSGCNQNYKFAMAVRGVLQASKARTENALRAKEISAAQALRAFKFYDEQLRQLKLPDCRVALKVITEDPRRTTTIPKPLYPPEE